MLTNRVDAVGYPAVLVLTLAPLAGLVLARRRLGRLNTAASLVTWAAAVLSLEHAGLSLSFANRPTVQLVDLGHASFHFFMAGAYTLVAAGLLTMVAWMILRKGDPIGWYAILFTLLFASGFELVARTTLFPHGLRPRSIPAGIFLYSYTGALVAALLISYRTIFPKQPSPPRSTASPSGPSRLPDDLTSSRGPE